MHVLAIYCIYAIHGYAMHSEARVFTIDGYAMHSEAPVIHEHADNRVHYLRLLFLTFSVHKSFWFFKVKVVLMSSICRVSLSTCPTGLLRFHEVT